MHSSWHRPSAMPCLRWVAPLLWHCPHPGWGRSQSFSFDVTRMRSAFRVAPCILLVLQWVLYENLFSPLIKALASTRAPRSSARYSQLRGLSSGALQKFPLDWVALHVLRFQKITQVIAWTRHAPVRTWHQCTSLTLGVSRRLALSFVRASSLTFVPPDRASDAKTPAFCR
jgi:hypothetical protein